MATLSLHLARLASLRRKSSGDRNRTAAAARKRDEHVTLERRLAAAEGEMTWLSAAAGGALSLSFFAGVRKKRGANAEKELPFSSGIEKKGSSSSALAPPLFLRTNLWEGTSTQHAFNPDPTKNLFLSFTGSSKRLQQNSQYLYRELLPNSPLPFSARQGSGGLDA